MPHLSLDDAKMTMLVAKYICHELHLDINHLIAKYPSCKFNSIEYIEELNKRKLERQEHSQNYQWCHQAWRTFCLQHDEIANNQSTDYKNVAIANSIINDEEALNNVINKILELQLIPRLHSDQARYLVVNNEDERNKIVQNKSIKSTTKILTYAEFIDFSDDNFNKEA